MATVCTYCDRQVKEPCHCVQEAWQCDTFHEEKICNYCDEYSVKPCKGPDEASMCPKIDHDPIDPNHYKQWEIEPIDFIMKNKLDYATGNVIKYVMRHTKKNGLEDLRKAEKYLKFLMQQHYGVE